MARTLRSIARRKIKRRRKRVLQSRDLETLTNPQINMKSRRWRKLQRAREWCEWYYEQQRQHELRKRSLNVILWSAGAIGIFIPIMLRLFAMGCVARLVKTVADYDAVDKRMQALLELRVRRQMPDI